MNKRNGNQRAHLSLKLFVCFACLVAGAAESVLAGAASAELLIGSSGDSQQSARLIPHSLASEDFLEPDTDTLEPAEEPLTLFPLFLEDEP